jgi:hypothetical protein
MASQISININFKKDKQGIISSLLLIYFVVYAISPLSYTYSIKKIVDKIGDTNGMSASLKNLNIFLLDVICAKIDSPKNIDHADSTVRVLFRKARAILPENANERFAPPKTLLLFGHIKPFYGNSLAKLFVSFDRVNSIQGFNPLHSGPAPPLA